jgi:hypothetical protein
MELRACSALFHVPCFFHLLFYRPFVWTVTVMFRTSSYDVSLVLICELHISYHSGSGNCSDVYSGGAWIA